MTFAEILLVVGVVVVIIGGPIWLIVHLIDKIRPKKPSDLDNTV